VDNPWHRHYCSARGLLLLWGQCISIAWFEDTHVKSNGSAVQPSVSRNGNTSFVSHAFSWLDKFIWYTVLLGALVLIFWVLFSFWQFWKVLLVGAFVGGGLVLRLSRPKLAGLLNRFSMRLLAVSLVALILIPLAGCTYKGASWFTDPVVPTAHGIVSRAEWFSKDLPNWWGKQNNACHQFIIVQDVLLFNINVSYSGMIAEGLLGYKDIKSTTVKLPQNLTLHDDIIGYYKTDLIPLYREGISAIFKKPLPSSAPRDCVCLRGDCVREWYYAFSVQKPGE
jgi:hypothetical protein